MQVNETQGAGLFWSRARQSSTLLWKKEAKAVGEPVRGGRGTEASAAIDDQSASRARTGEETEVEKEKESSSVLFLWLTDLYCHNSEADSDLPHIHHFVCFSAE